MLKVFLNLFFPRSCAICRRPLEDGDACGSCLSRIPVSGWTFCARCGSRLKNFDSCIRCRRAAALAGIGAATDYRRNDVRALIHAFKYRRRRSLAEPLADMLVRHARSSGLAEHLATCSAAVTAIPLTTGRQRRRGFNQSALLAEKLAVGLNLPYRPGMIARAAERPPQVTMPDAKSRRENIAGAFRPAAPALIRGQTILLVDDVASSGATLEEAARTLKRAGAKAVWAVIVARGH